LPNETRYVLGDLHYNTLEVRQPCENAQRNLVTPKYGEQPSTGIEVRRIFHELRSSKIKNSNEQFKSIFNGPPLCPRRDDSIPPALRWGLFSSTCWKLRQ
jgi:hypothetical protein